MITRIQNFFLKHNKWLFGGLLVVIIVTFVLTIGPQSFFGSGGTQQRQSLQFYGYDLTSESDQRAMALTAEISAIFHPELRLRREQLMDYAYIRTAALGIANQLGIPQPTKEELSGFVETLEAFQNLQTGEFSPTTYKMMMDSLQSGDRYGREAIATVLSEDYRIKQVRMALAGPDYSLPFELEKSYTDMQTRYQVAIADFQFADFNPTIEASDEELLQYFNENPARYEIPETITVAALMFKADNYLDLVGDPKEADLEAYFRANKTRFGADSDDDEITLETVREEVLNAWRLAEATKLAAKKGEQFSLRLWQESIALDSPEFEALIEQFAAQEREIPAYSRGNPPRIQDAPAELLSSMWIYTNNPNRYFSDIGQIADGAVVLVTRGITEARMPEITEVKSKVLEDYRQTEKRRLFAEKGSELRDTIQSRLETESFTEIAESLDLEVTSFDEFTGETVPDDLTQTRAWDQAQFLEANAVSEMVLRARQGTFVYMKEKVVPQLDPTSEGFQEFVSERTNALGDALGWSRLREISDQSLAALLGPQTVEE